MMPYPLRAFILWLDDTTYPWRRDRWIKKMQGHLAKMTANRQELLNQIRKLNEAIEKADTERKKGRYRGLILKIQTHLKIVDQAMEEAVEKVAEVRDAPIQ
jgi:hypothetical protein